MLSVGIEILNIFSAAAPAFVTSGPSEAEVPAYDAPKKIANIAMKIFSEEKGRVLAFLEGRDQAGAGEIYGRVRASKKWGYKERAGASPGIGPGVGAA